MSEILTFLIIFRFLQLEAIFEIFDFGVFVQILNISSTANLLSHSVSHICTNLASFRHFQTKFFLSRNGLTASCL